jgi:hypothetical protein
MAWRSLQIAAMSRYLRMSAERLHESSYQNRIISIGKTRQPLQRRRPMPKTARVKELVNTKRWLRVSVLGWFEIFDIRLTD